MNIVKESDKAPWQKQVICSHCGAVLEIFDTDLSKDAPNPFNRYTDCLYYKLYFECTCCSRIDTFYLLRCSGLIYIKSIMMPTWVYERIKVKR